ncbi:hypothetical protein B296_00051155 [Ensete ventricosum]|uniref:Uncharacterized protein n=1 Tax=Ensete ventricosum TaxID=4639 RepID=A0A426YI54_ENSVE|nr:hypothetical protein B296_00051155 [Ensete ventricosum]
MDSVPVLSLEELDLLVVVGSGAEVQSSGASPSCNDVAAPGLIIMPTQASCGSVVMFFPRQFLWLGGSADSRWGEGLCAVDRVVTLVLRAPWFSLSSYSRAKEITTVIV